MWRLSMAVVLTVVLSALACGQNTNATKSGEPVRSVAEKKLLENPNDSQAISAYLTEVMTAVMQLMQRDPEAARKKLDAMEAFVGELKVDDPMAKSRLSSLKMTAQFYRDRIDVQNVPLSELEAKLLENPGDAKAIRSFVTKLQMEIATIVRTQPDLAETKLAAAKAALDKAREKAADDAARRQLSSLTSGAITALQRSIDTGRMSLADLGKKLTDDPNSLPSLMDFNNKIMSEIPSLLRTQPEEAEKKIELAKEVFQKVEAGATNQSIKTMLTNYKRSLDSMARTVEAGKKLTEMIGKDAAPLKVETWVNGSPLTDADLKGKVVFLDFWAVWCGPCIATFPHLREWNEKYGDKGLVMIGVTNYYNYKWDAEAKKAGRVQDKVTPAEEQEMLVHFAESHDLKHRFAIESQRSLSDYYGVSGIPHVVVIDQEGKIRLMKVGSGEANAKDIAELLEQLLGQKAAGS